MTTAEIARCRAEQQQCKAVISDPGRSPEDKRMAMLGLDDWQFEEILLSEKKAGDSYGKFLARKKRLHAPAGIEYAAHPEHLYKFQRHITQWALRLGKSAIFADCGLGKTIQQLEWAHQIVQHTGGNVLILAPLAVSWQTQKEGRRFGYSVTVARDQSGVHPGINITNYEMLHHFDARQFIGVVLDESSILKSYSGKMRNQIIGTFSNTPYRLACTATPSPNDLMEIGNHSEFLGVMNRTSMLATFFNHDGGETSKWKLKGHARKPFYEWLASWCVMVSKPSDLGYADDGFTLPEMTRHYHTVNTGAQSGFLFPVEAESLSERREARTESLDGRLEKCHDLVTGNRDQWLIWGDLNRETDGATDLFTNAVQVSGSDTAEHKEKAMLGFADGSIDILVTKPKIAGFGMNWQNCHQMVFMGLSDSYESSYQAERRCWRFGQTKSVDVHVLMTDRDASVVRNVERKRIQAEEMKQEMVYAMGAELNMLEGSKWEMHHGDCIQVLAGLRDESIDYTIFSPPFASLYTYSDDLRDMGNCETHEEFFEHLSFLTPELHRVTVPGRLVSFHCMNLPKSKERDGVIGLSDFRGRLIRSFEAAGFVLASEVTIWKDPVTAMQRTKAIGLLWKQLKKDSSLSRQGIPDYLVTMRKPGVNPRPIKHTPGEFPVETWQRWASPVWMDIDPGDTLQYTHARSEKDERHICPLQLGVIRRGINLWSNPDDLVLSPFAGIGSEGYVAMEEGRRFVGVELKREYYEWACKNLEFAAQNAGSQGRLFHDSLVRA